MGRPRKDDNKDLVPGLFFKKGVNGRPDRYYAKFAFKGEQVSRALGTRKDLAIKELVKLKDECERLGHVPKETKATMADVWKEFQTYRKNNGYRDLGRDIRTWNARLAPVFADVVVSDVTQEMVREYRQGRLNNDSIRPTTANRETSQLSRMLAYAAGFPSKFGISKNPLIGMGILPENESNWRRPTLSKDNEDRLLTECRKAANKAPYIHDLVFLALRTGARLSELLGLTWDRVNLSAKLPDGRVIGTVTFTGTKNADARTVPLPQDAFNLLKARQEIGTGYVITTTDPKHPGVKVPVKVEAASQCFARISRRLELPGDTSPKCSKFDNLRFHDLRHVAGERLRSAGADLITLMDYLGHKDMSCSKRYSKERIEDTHKWVSRAAENTVQTPVKR
jgi:integrase